MNKRRLSPRSICQRFRFVDGGELAQHVDVLGQTFTLGTLTKAVPQSRMGHFDTPVVVQEIFRQGEGPEWDFEPATNRGGMEVTVDDGCVDDWSDVKVRVYGNAKWSPADGKFSYDVEVTIPKKSIARVD